jgi:hypothetical protein
MTKYHKYNSIGVEDPMAPCMDLHIINENGNSDRGGNSRLMIEKNMNIISAQINLF